MPYGFRRVSDYHQGRAINTRNEINPEEMEVVKSIVAMHAKDMKYSQIARQLDSKGIKPRATGRKAKSTWNPSTIRSILNRFYGNRDDYPI